MRLSSFLSVSQRSSVSSDDNSMSQATSGDPSSIDDIQDIEDDIPDEWKDDGQIHIFKRCDMVQQVSWAPALAA